RDFHVTGVQTCALPILLVHGKSLAVAAAIAPEQNRRILTAFLQHFYQRLYDGRLPCPAQGHIPDTDDRQGRRISAMNFFQACLRSEERRVGKECSYRMA